MLNIHCFTFNQLQENSYLLWDETGASVVADPGCQTDEEKRELAAYIEKKGLSLRYILLTHAHFDHIYGVPYLMEAYGASVFMAGEETEVLRSNSMLTGAMGLPYAPEAFAFSDLVQGQEICFGITKLEVIETPGHSPGGRCFLDSEDGILITGDSLFAGSIGRTDLPGGDYDKLIVSVMEKLIWLPGDTDILPGHGPVSSIGRERTQNPFLEPFNEDDAQEALSI